MPLILPDKLPAIERLRAEGFAVSTGGDASLRRNTHDTAPDWHAGKRALLSAHDTPLIGTLGGVPSYPARPLRIAVLNLMPMKEVTETDLARVLSASPLWIEVQLMRIGSHMSRHTSAEHMGRFYRTFEAMREERFDGLIITGAPLEHLDYEQVTYWHELQEIFEWSRTHAHSTLYICWAAQAGLYHHYGVPKYPLPRKMFGIFPQRILSPTLPLFRDISNPFPMPHSRHTELRREDILQRPELSLIAESEESGVGIGMARDGREIFVTGHSEYAPLTLDTEYHRDLAKGLPIEKPLHYYEGDDPTRPPVPSWRAPGTQLFVNWVDYLRTYAATASAQRSPSTAALTMPPA